MQSTISYSNNTEYRQCLSKIFNINITPQNYNNPDLENILKQNEETLDEETLDELCYDESCASAIMDKWYADTASNPQFQKLYDLAAAKMISTDREIGLAVLLSYDYLQVFYPYLMVHLSKGNSANYLYDAILRKLT